MHFISIINNDWITIMGNSRHELSQPRSQGSLLPVPTCWRKNLGTRLELSTVRMLYSLKKLSCYPLPPHNSHLSTTATFFSPQGGRCGGVRLYFHSCNFHHRVIYELTMACSPVGLISSMDWALRRSGCDSLSGLRFFFFQNCSSFWECSIFCVSSAMIALSFNRSTYLVHYFGEIEQSSCPWNRDLNAHVQSVAWRKQLFFAIAHE